MDQLVNEVFDFIFIIALPFGPAAYLFWRWRKKEHALSDDAIKAVFSWTVIMLLFTVGREINTKLNLRNVCDDLENALIQKFGDSDAAREEMPYFCFRED